MSIDRKWEIAHAVVWDDDTVWVAETRAKTGTWVVRELRGDRDEEHPVFGWSAIGGAYFPFDEEQTGCLLHMSIAEREALRMSDEVFSELNVSLRSSFTRDKEITRARDDILGEINRLGLRDKWNRCAWSETTPTLLSWLGGTRGAADILEGMEIAVGSLRLRRIGGMWTAVGEFADQLDAECRANLGLDPS